MRPRRDGAAHPLHKTDDKRPRGNTCRDAHQLHMRTRGRHPLLRGGPHLLVRRALNLNREEFVGPSPIHHMHLQHQAENN